MGKMISRSRIFVAALLIFLATSVFLGRTRIGEQFQPPEPTQRPSDDVDIDRFVEKSEFEPSASLPGDCAYRPDWLRELEGTIDITFPLNYARRDILVQEKPGVERASVTELPQQLLPGFQEIRSLDDPGLVEKNCLPPLTLDIPSIPQHIDASHILFGAATTVKRLDASVPFFRRWLPSTGARLVVDVKGEDDKQADPKRVADLENRMRGLGMLVTLVPAFEKEGNYVERYFSLVKTVYKHKTERTTWFAIIDDDTFFTSMSGLVSRLAEYDSHKRWYLGAVSEEWWTVCQYGWIAMGGGGIFLSVPLMEVLDANYFDCKKNSKRTFGDQKIAECIERHTDTRFTQVDGLHQMDLHGDRSGLFEGGRPLLSQHHWKEGYWSENGTGEDAIRHSRWFPMDTMSLVSDVCGDTCFLQRWQFGNDTVLTNGYSIAMYPKGHLKNLELFKTEKTWVTPTKVEGSLNSGFDHYLGPLRPALKLDEEKLHYRFMDAKIMKDGGVRQYYRHLGKDGELDSLIELRWMREGAHGNSTSS